MSSCFIKYVRSTPAQFKVKDVSNGDGFDVRVVDVSIPTGYGRVELGWTEGVLNDKSIAYIQIAKGMRFRAHLGFAMRLPEGYKAVLLPRSSTPAKIGCIQANSEGLIDQTYAGDKDEWMQEFVALEDTTIVRYERIGQFTIEKVNKFPLEEVASLGSDNRGGFGDGTKAEV